MTVTHTLVFVRMSVLENFQILSMDFLRRAANTSDLNVYWDAIEIASWILAVPCFSERREGSGRDREGGQPKREVQP